mmetsp:Transcript_20369/g.17667  ORF Transcript_20369/g.17667 Transcript_20369/m.17667 type:complete len:283 (+) Transcript_20369:344-1192(+)
MIFGISLVIMAGERFAYYKSWKKIYPILYQLKVITRSNIFIMLLCSSFDEIILYSHLEFHNQDNYGNSTVKAFGIILAIAGIFIMLYLMINGLMIVTNYQKIKKNVSSMIETKEGKKQLEEFSAKWENYTLFFRGYKDRSIKTQGYLLLYLTRLILFSMVITFLIDYSLVQISLILAMNIFMLVYNIAVRPTLSKNNITELCTYEALLLVANTGMFAMAIMDKCDIEGEGTRENIGNMIILLFLLFTLASLVFMCIDICKGIYVAYKTIKREGRKKGCMLFV